MKLRSKLALATGLSIPVTAIAATVGGCSKDRSAEYHIVTINDFHGAVPGYGEDVSVVDSTNPGCFRLKKAVDKVLDRYPGSVFLSAGDENSGDSWSTCSHGQTTYPILKAMGVRYCAVGNHAFEWGLNDMSTGLYDRLGRTAETKDKYFVTSNVFSVAGYNFKSDWCIDQTQTEKFQEDFELWNKLRVSWADPYKILEFGNAKVCLIGLTTQGTIEDSNKDVTQHMSFIQYDPSVHYAKYLAKQELGEEKFNEIDSFILFTHCAGEYNEDQKAITGEVADMAKNISTDIDAIMSAHSHKKFCGSFKNKHTGKDVWVSQAGTAGRAFTDTKLLFNPLEKPGKRLKSISMSVTDVPLTTDATTSKEEWKRYYENGNDNLAIAYNYERQWVNQFFDRDLSVNNLSDDEMQNMGSFKGYYGSVKTGISPITGQRVVPGHDYWMPEDILDHFGGWLSRAIQLGFYYSYIEQIRGNLGVMPSCHFVSQDTAPANLKTGKIKVRELYNMIHYDNFVNLSYLSICQLANIINYNLAGEPDSKQELGFKYKTSRDYEPDLTTFIGDPSSETTAKATKIVTCDQSSGSNIVANYVCGPMSFSGLQVKLTPITEAEHDVQIESAATTGTPLRYVYDRTAKYRVSTSKQDVIDPTSGETISVMLPDIKVFEYVYDTESQTDNIEKFDDPTSDAWKPANYWYQLELNKEGLIPVITNNFLYGGGNNQYTMFKRYHDWNKQQFGQFYFQYQSTYTLRDVIETFLIRGRNEEREWKEGLAPVNIPWSYVKSLIDK